MNERFVLLSHQHGIYRRIGSSTRADVLAPAPSMTTRVERHVSQEYSIAAVADQQLLEQLAPSAVVVRSSGHIIRMYGAMERYIELPTGDAPWDICALLTRPK
jgi:hypothetical protein